MLAAIAITLPGCTPEPPSQRETTNTTSIQHPTTRPPISRPLDATRYADARKVCDLLTNEQAASLDIIDDTPISESRGDGGLYRCVRDQSEDQHGPTVVQYSLDVSGDWLGEEYGRSYIYDDFSPVDIHGQPAVLFGKTSSTLSPEGEILCNLVLGLTEQQGLKINLSDDSGKACERAVKVAEHMVRNLGG